MLQRMVKQVTTAAARPPRRRADSSSSSVASAQDTRRRRSRPESDASSSAASSAVRKPKSKPKSKTQAVRTPLLDPRVIDEVYRALHGEGERRRARQQVLQLFAAYDRDDNQVIPAASFIKCIKKCGVRFKNSADYDHLVLCFRDPSAQNDDDEEALVAYPAFVEFACNVRDSEALSEIALKLRKRIDRFEEENPRDSPAPILAALKKLDKAQRSWIPPKRFAEFLLDSDRPPLKLKRTEVEMIVERFEYEFDASSNDEDEAKSTGVDYTQFVQWLQPMQHINAKELHAQVKQLITTATTRNGWDLDELFDAMDDDGNGEISRKEFKQALREMGLPITDAQMERLVSEYDVDGDGRIQYREFTSFFDSKDEKKTTKKKAAAKTKHQSSTSDQGSTDVRAKRKQATRQKNTVRNTFSWGITKAFARKNAAKDQASNKKTPTSSKRPALTSSDEDDSESQNRRKGANTQKKKQPKDSNSDSTSSQGEGKKAHTKKAKANSKKQTSSSEDDSVKDQRPGKKSKRPKRQQNNTSSPDDSSTEPQRQAPSRKKKVSVTTDEEQKGGESTATTATEATKRAAHRSKRQASTSPRKKSDRKLSTVSNNNRERPRTPSSRSHARRRSQSQSRSNRRQSAASIRKSRHRSNNTSHRARLHWAGKRRGKHREETFDSTSSAGSDQHGRQDDSSSSGIDVDQVRQIKQQRNPNHEGWSDSGEEQNNADLEYEKHLKRSLRRAFDFFDLDRSEMIEKRELNTVLRALGHEFTHEELDAEMAQADLDNNGHLDFEEFVKFVKRQLAQKAFLLSKRREMEIRQSFQSLDSDKNGVLDEKEFEYLVYKVLQVELSVEELDALLDFVDGNGDGTISEEEFITFMKVMEEFYKHGGGTKKQARFLVSLDGTSKLACAAMKKLVRGAPMDLDRSLLAFFGIPTNYRPAISSAATCRLLQSNTIEHALSFPSPKTIMAMAQDLSAQPNLYALGTKDNSSEEWLLLQQAETWEHHAIVSIKRAAGVPRPFDAREEDVVKRCVHVCLYQEQGETRHHKPTNHRKHGTIDSHHGKDFSATARTGAVVGNVHEIPVYWHAGEEDVWQFSKKATKEDKYKFLVRTNSVNDHLYLLVELIVHLRMGSRDNGSDADDTKRKKTAKKKAMNRDETIDKQLETREMVCCWCKIPLRTLLAKRSDVFRSQEKLWGGTAHVPVDVEHDEILRRRTGWRAMAKMFQKPIPPCIGLKSAPIERFPEELQKFVQQMPPTIIAPFVSIPVLAEYMTLMETMLSSSNGASAAVACKPVLKLLPKIVDDHEALSAFRKVFDEEAAPLKSPEDRQRKFQELVLRMWPSFIAWQTAVPASLLLNPPVATSARQRANTAAANPSQLTAPDSRARAATTATDSKETVLSTAESRALLLSTTARGQLRLQDLPMAAAPFHIREIAFERLL